MVRGGNGIKDIGAKSGMLFSGLNNLIGVIKIMYQIISVVLCVDVICLYNSTWTYVMHRSDAHELHETFEG
jgi:hypothetical protein